MVLGKKINVNLKSHKEHVNLYMCVVAGSGERKSRLRAGCLFLLYYPISLIVEVQCRMMKILGPCFRCNVTKKQYFSL